MLQSKLSMNDSILDVAILGAGPGGLSAAARAAQRRLSHVLLEAGDKHAEHYPAIPAAEACDVRAGGAAPAQ